MKGYHFIIPKGFSLYKNSSIIYQTHVFISILTALGYRISITPLAPTDSNIEAANAEHPIAQLGHSSPGIKSTTKEHQ
jgi:hypothetical protein